MKRPDSGKRPGGGEGGGPRGGGMGERPEMPKPLSLDIKVKLALPADIQQD